MHAAILCCNSEKADCRAEIGVTIDYFLQTNESMMPLKIYRAVGGTFEEICFKRQTLFVNMLPYAYKISG